jgi:pectate lyase
LKVVPAHSSRSERTATGASFSIFDPGTFYEYTLDAAAEVETLVTRCAGPRAGLGH